MWDLEACVSEKVNLKNKLSILHFFLLFWLLRYQYLEIMELLMHYPKSRDHELVRNAFGCNHHMEFFGETTFQSSRTDEK